MNDHEAQAEVILKEHREAIDRLDAILIYALAERFKQTKAVGKLKAEHKLPPADAAREARMVERLEQHAESAGLDPEFARKFIKFVFQEVIRHHESQQK